MIVRRDRFQEITVSRAEDLQTVLATLEGDVLFRGQTTHFDYEGQPPVVTWFDRKGCILCEMMKWSRFTPTPHPDTHPCILHLYPTHNAGKPAYLLLRHTVIDLQRRHDPILSSCL